jgi:nitrate/nitrite-specific signal transduction histidine kinase
MIVPSTRAPAPQGGRSAKGAERRFVIVDDHAKAAAQLTKLSESASERTLQRTPETIERVLEAARVELGMEVAVGIVGDNGRGFDRKPPERAEVGGLAYMAERASLLGGSCSIESVPGKGTRVETCFPLGSAELPAH